LDGIITNSGRRVGMQAETIPAEVSTTHQVQDFSSVQANVRRVELEEGSEAIDAGEDNAVQIVQSGHCRRPVCRKKGYTNKLPNR
jgi:hypothetical protein